MSTLSERERLIFYSSVDRRKYDDSVESKQCNTTRYSLNSVAPLRTVEAYTSSDLRNPVT